MSSSIAASCRGSCSLKAGLLVSENNSGHLFFGCRLVFQALLLVVFLSLLFLHWKRHRSFGLPADFGHLCWTMLSGLYDGIICLNNFTSGLQMHEEESERQRLGLGRRRKKGTEEAA